ncbi:MAG: hypothetical protein IKY10_02835 [Clostridia bacterium]|nr:hypothetical protein [Clostridia bacterium]
MTRNDTLFKILFAIEIALLPLAMASYLIMPVWAVGIFVACILVAKIWIELFKEKGNRSHKIILAIGNVLTISSLVIFFTVYGYINLALCIVAVILVVLTNLLRFALKNELMPEIIDAVDSCYTLFECAILITLTFVVFYELATSIALFALVLTSVVSVLYKAYFLLRHKGGFDRIKNLFRRK